MNLRSCAPLLTCACASLALAACGSSSSSPTAGSTATSTPAPAPAQAPASVPSSAAATVALQADPSGQLAYVQKSLTASAGKVTIALTNQSTTPHDVAIELAGRQLGATPVSAGSTTKLTLTLAKGSYTYFCTVPGHRQAGMQGTLTVS